MNDARLAIGFALDLATPEETWRVGHSLGQVAVPGLVVALIGPLGAGKTTFVKGVAAGAGVVNPDSVSSPTFVLIHEYSGRLPIAHFDAYRMKSSDEFGDLGPEEYFSTCLCLIEWADRVEAWLPPNHWRVTFEPLGGDARRLFAQVSDGENRSLFAEWRRRVSTAVF